MSVSRHQSTAENDIVALKSIHALVLLAGSGLTAKQYRDHSCFKFSKMSLLRIRTELMVFVKALAKMYASERIVDVSTRPLPRRLCNEGKATHVSTEIPRELKYGFMCENIEKGDTIEWIMRSSLEDPNHHKLIRRATVAAIRFELDKTKTVILNNGDKITNSLHLVRRVSMKDLETGEALWNPIRDWFELSRFYLHPTEDAADGPSKSLAVHVDAEDMEEFKLAERHNKAGKMKQMTRAVQKRRRMKEHDQLSMIHTGNMAEFLGWMPERRVEQEILFLNGLYLSCIMFGKIGYFYKLLSTKNSKEYKTSKAYANRKIREEKQKKEDNKKAFRFERVFKFPFFVKFHERDASAPSHVLHPEVKDKRPTNRDVQVREGISDFEKGNQQIKPQKCIACKEIHLNKVTENFDQEAIYHCKRCQKCTLDYWDKWFLQPIWYERIEGATHFDDYKYGPDGKKIIRYDLPEELVILSMSEMLLIRKCAPYVPSVYLSGGNFALKGQCVAFSQNISTMTEELPRHPNQIVTFLRQMGNSKTSEVKFKSLRVRRDYVIRALKWLKIHHCEYRNITIKESNLDWVGKAAEAESHMLGHVKNFHQTGTCPPPQSAPTVSQVQCNDPLDEPELEMAMMIYNEEGMEPTQKDHIEDLVAETVKAKKKDKLLMFPPHEDTPVRSVERIIQLWVAIYPFDKLTSDSIFHF